MIFKKQPKTDAVAEKKEPVSQAAGVHLPQKPTKVAHKILIKPIITEKATGLETFNKYTFEAFRSANKIEIKKAVKELYNVEPIDVRIVVVKGKDVRYGRVSGRTKKWKKAIITLKKGQKIEFTKK